MCVIIPDLSVDHLPLPVRQLDAGYNSKIRRKLFIKYTDKHLSNALFKSNSKSFNKITIITSYVIEEHTLISIIILKAESP